MNNQVLIIDDNLNIASGLASLLGNAGFTTQFAVTYAEAEILVGGFSSPHWKVILFDGILDKHQLSLSLIRLARTRLPDSLLIAMSDDQQIRELQVNNGCDWSLDKNDINGIIRVVKEQIPA